MNRYGTQLMRQWQTADPRFVESLSDPSSHFEQIGRQVEAEIFEILPSLEGKDSPGETYLEKVGRLQAARAQAEEIILSEYRPPSDSPEMDEPEGWDSMLPDAQEAWIEQNVPAGEQKQEMLRAVATYRATRWALHPRWDDSETTDDQG